jgi:hypothetical protein
LAVDPAQRFASMEALLTVLEAKLQAGAPELLALPTRAVVDELEGHSLRSDGIVELDSLGISPILDAPSNLPAVVGQAGLALPSEEAREGHATSLSTRRTLAGVVDEATIEILTRELDRLEHRRGKVERLGACVAWSTRGLEVHVDVTPQGTEILVWRRLEDQLRRRAVGWTVFGCWLGCMFIAVTLGGMDLAHGALEALVPLVVLGSLIGGSVMGYRKALGRHARALPSERAKLEFIADRLVGLARANAPRALSEG